jgi:hypothetical protein
MSRHHRSQEGSGLLGGDEGIPQGHHAVVRVDEIGTQRNRITQPLGGTLAGVEKARLPFKIGQVRQDPLVPGLLQHRHELGIHIEVILNHALSPPGDDENLAQSSSLQFLHHVLKRRLASHRQHFLGLGLGGWQEPRAQPGCRDDRFGYQSSHKPPSSFNERQ